MLLRSGDRDEREYLTALVSDTGPASLAKARGGDVARAVNHGREIVNVGANVPGLRAAAAIRQT